MAGTEAKGGKQLEMNFVKDFMEVKGKLFTNADNAIMKSLAIYGFDPSLADDVMNYIHDCVGE